MAMTIRIPAKGSPFWKTARQKAESMLGRLDVSPVEGEAVAIARIASDMEKRISDVGKGTRIWVTGHTGEMLDPEIYTHWHSLLRKWIGAGADVTLFLASSEVSPQVRKTIRDIRETETAGSLTAYRVSPRKRPPDDDVDAQVLKQMETFHFTLVTSPDHLWLEPEHLSGQTEKTMNCWHYKGPNARNHPLFGVFEERFQEMRDRYGEVVR